MVKSQLWSLVAIGHCQAMIANCVKICYRISPKLFSQPGEEARRSCVGAWSFTSGQVATKAKLFGLTPLSAQISAFKFQNLSVIPLKSVVFGKVLVFDSNTTISRGVWLKHHSNRGVNNKHPPAER